MNQVRRNARNHAEAMTRLHIDMEKVAETAAKLVATLATNAPGPTEYGPLYQKVDDAMGKLGEAYEQLAAAFDDLPE